MGVGKCDYRQHLVLERLKMNTSRGVGMPLGAYCMSLSYIHISSKENNI